MKRHREPSMDSTGSNDISAVQPQTIKLTPRDRAYETVIATLRKRINELQATVPLVEKEGGNVGRGTPGVSQPATEAMRGLEEENEKLTTKIKQLESKISSELDKARSEMMKLKEQLTSREAQIRVLVKDKLELISSNEALEQRVAAALQESNLQTNLRQALRNNYDNLMREFDRATQRGDGFVQKIYGLQGELERVESTKRELVEEVNRLMANRNSFVHIEDPPPEYPEVDYQ